MIDGGRDDIFDLTVALATSIVHVVVNVESSVTSSLAQAGSAAAGGTEMASVPVYAHDVHVKTPPGVADGGQLLETPIPVVLVGGVGVGVA